MVTAIIQARMGSSRLPGKVLAPVCGRPLLWHMVKRLRRASRVQQIVIATTKKAIDHPIIQLADSLNVCVVTGSETDVLDRMYQAATFANADPVVRLTADCPLIDPELIDRVVSAFSKAEADYAALSPTYPNGLETEVFRFDVLACAWREAVLPSEREHVTPFIRKRSNRFRVLEIPSEEDWGDLRWTVDEARDLDLVREIFSELYAGKQAFSFLDIVQLMRRRPELPRINHGIPRNQGYQVSLEQDAAWLRVRQKSAQVLSPIDVLYGKSGGSPSLGFRHSKEFSGMSDAWLAMQMRCDLARAETDVHNIDIECYVEADPFSPSHIVKKPFVVREPSH